MTDSDRTRARVLIVEKRSNQRLLFELALRDEGYLVYSLEKVEDLETFVRFSRPGVVVLDPCAPGDSPDARCTEPGIPDLGVPVVIYSTCDCLASTSMPEGVRFIKKTSDPSELIAHLRLLLDD